MKIAADCRKGKNGIDTLEISASIFIVCYTERALSETGSMKGKMRREARMRIVIADGEAQVRAEVEELLRKAGADYELAGAASDGREGYELIMRECPDLVIMDIRMPKMDGLSMLRKLRAAGAACRVIVLTADMDFDKARQAIELGIDNYILKPLKKPQLKKAVLSVKQKLEDEQVMASAFTVENIFRGCLNGQVHPDGKFHAMTREKYGFTLEEPVSVCTIWLGSSYTEQREDVKRVLENAAADREFSVCVLEVDAWRVLTAVVYCMQDAWHPYLFFKEHVVPLLCGSFRGEIVCIWSDMENGLELLDGLKEIERMREWNLLFDRGDLIRKEDVEEIEALPLKYPAELELQARQAAREPDGEEIKKCYYRLYDRLRNHPVSPAEMKECLIRFNLAVLNAYKAQHEIQSELRIQNCMQAITVAMSWGQIRTAMEEFFHAVNFNAYSKEDMHYSPLIRKAVQLVRKYYDQGVTLEEIAGQLFVSEEYLSTQFKKETGAGFAETVRNYRIERIKGLLVNTRLKLNQIAELTGYADPKYMSRVFKEEVGVLPTEYRKSFH